MVGAITVLIIVVAVFLAYNANSGLPFVPSYRITAQVPDANTIVPGNEVRLGGVRVGQVEDITPVAQDDGSATARIDLKLDDDVRELPQDSTVIVRARSALGLKYLEIVQGTSPEGFPEGSVMPLTAARPEPVELDEILDIFDEPTRAALQRNLLELGNTLAGRGPAINSALGELAPVLRRLQPVAQVLAAPRSAFDCRARAEESGSDPDRCKQTNLGRLIRGLGATTAQLAPVANVGGELFVSLETTFVALAAVARPFLQETITRLAPTLDTATATLPRIRPFLSNTAGLFRELQPGVASLARLAPDLAAAFRVGIPALRKTPKLNRQLPPTTAALKRFNDDTSVRTGLSTLIETSEQLTPTLRFIAPAQFVCNYATLLLRNASSLLSLGFDGTTKSQRFINFEPPAGPNNEGSPSSGPADGPETANFLHVNPYPNTASPGQTRECEAGNEPYAIGEQVIGNPPGNQGTTTEGQK
jgi:ABC-type transporter Mla subunit MlaD